MRTYPFPTDRSLKHSRNLNRSRSPSPSRSRSRSRNLNLNRNLNRNRNLSRNLNRNLSRNLNRNLSRNRQSLAVRRPRMRQANGPASNAMSLTTVKHPTWRLDSYPIT